MNLKKILTYTLLTTTLPVVAVADNVNHQLGVIDSGIRYSKARNMGEINVMTPYSVSGNSVSLINYIGKRSNKGGMEFNLGLAQRTLKDNGIHGTYGYFDIRKTPTGNSFTQITIGKELLSKKYDLRINGYLPISGKKELKNKTTNIKVDNAGNINAITEDYEIPMMGFDGEYGKLIKTPNSEMGAWLAYYNFWGTTGNARRVDGFRLRTEYRMTNIPTLSNGSKLIFGLEMQHDKPRGTQNILSLRLSVPFGNVAKVQKTGDSYYDERILEPIIRDIDIVTGNNQKYEVPLDEKTGKPFKQVKYVSNQKELADAIYNGEKNKIIVIKKSFNTGSMLKVGKGQIITSGNTKIKFKTASGGVGSYQPSSGEQKTIKAKHKSQRPLDMGDYKNLRGVTTYSKNFKGEEVREDVSLLNGDRRQLDAGNHKIKGMYNSTGEKTGRTYTVICSIGGEIFKAEYCGSSSEDSSSLTINNKGELTVQGFTNNSMKMFKVVMNYTEGGKTKKVSSEINLFSGSGVKAKALKAIEDYLPNEENYRGIRLLYGNAFKCTNDDAGKDWQDSFLTNASKCDRTVGKKTKIDHVKEAIDSILDKIGTKNGNEYSKAIENALKKNGSTMTLFNNSEDKGKGIVTYTQLKNSQDLQATETFATHTNARKGKAKDGIPEDGGGVKKEDATLEEVLHLIQNYGLSQANPEWQDKINEITENNYDAGGLVKYTDVKTYVGENEQANGPDGFDDRTPDGYKRDDSGNYELDDDGNKIPKFNGDNLPRRDMATEYFAGALESYFNIHARDTTIISTGSKRVCRNNTNDANKNCGSGESSRGDLKDHHRNMYDLIESMFGSGDKFWKN